MNNTLSGVLKGQGDAFVQAGKKYGIDPALLAAIAIHETGNGTSNAAKNKNNVGGMMGKNGLMSFSSIQEGIDKMASNLKRNYFDQGLTSIAQIQRKYAPVGAANDPTNLNKNWISGVTKYYNMFS
ncbi:glucosaminidase domain-containing protein [Paenibacillus motobuensis]|uniref:Mannosyl-glycoprotein endo-beta-N-acetylglucosamidase-like domain-containing protein n=1 Tax=Paenibacillus motobuensis TaxID=295324 RepID=A0ABN0Y494_9BACL